MCINSIAAARNRVLLGDIRYAQGGSGPVELLSAGYMLSQYFDRRGSINAGAVPRQKSRARKQRRLSGMPCGYIAAWRNDRCTPDDPVHLRPLGPPVAMCPHTCGGGKGLAMAGWLVSVEDLNSAPGAVRKAGYRDAFVR